MSYLLIEDGTLTSADIHAHLSRMAYPHSTMPYSFTFFILPSVALPCVRIWTNGEVFLAVRLSLAVKVFAHTTMATAI